MPFEVGGITFNTKHDRAIWSGSKWTHSAGSVVESNEVWVSSKANESLSGTQTIQSAVNREFVNMIGKNLALSVEDKTNLIEALNYVWVELKKAGYSFSLTETDTGSIRDIVINIKDKDNNVLLDKTLSDFILKTRKIAGYDLADDITDQEIQDAIKELTATLKNKTMSADDNTFIDFTPDEFKASAKKEGSSNNDKFTTQGYVDDEIAKVVATTYTFKGYVSATQPTSAKVGNLWYESATLPTTFPINVKTYNGTTWSATTSEYTPTDLDLWSLVADKHGYYWFGGEWNILDTSQATTDNTTIQRNNQDELEVKNGGVTNDKLASDIKVGSLANLLTTAKDSVVNAINELFNNKQDKISDSPNQNNPIDNDTLSNVSATSKTNKTWTFAQVWNWIITKLITNITSDSTDLQIASAKAVYERSKLYNHIINFPMSATDNTSMVQISIINRESTSFTIDTIKTFLSGKGFVSVEKLYPTSGCTSTSVVYVATTSGGSTTKSVAVAGLPSGLYVDNNTLKCKVNYNGSKTLSTISNEVVIEV